MWANRSSRKVPLTDPRGPGRGGKWRRASGGSLARQAQGEELQQIEVRGSPRSRSDTTMVLEREIPVEIRRVDAIADLSAVEPSSGPRSWGRRQGFEANSMSFSAIDGPGDGSGKRPRAAARIRCPTRSLPPLCPGGGPKGRSDRGGPRPPRDDDPLDRLGVLLDRKSSQINRTYQRHLGRPPGRLPGVAPLRPFGQVFSPVR